MQPNYPYIIGTISLHALIATATSTKEEPYTRTYMYTISQEHIHVHVYTPTQHVHIHVYVHMYTDINLQGGKNMDFPIPDVDFPMEWLPQA